MDLYEVGKRTVEAFDTRSRYFHFEFFRLDEDKPGLGKKGDLLGLEVNMRAPGAYMPDMLNWACDVDVYDIWAEMLVTDTTTRKYERKYSVGYASRRNANKYGKTFFANPSSSQLQLLYLTPKKYLNRIRI